MDKVHKSEFKFAELNLCIPPHVDLEELKEELLGLDIFKGNGWESLIEQNETFLKMNIVMYSKVENDN